MMSIFIPIKDKKGKEYYFVQGTGLVFKKKHVEKYGQDNFIKMQKGHTKQMLLNANSEDLTCGMEYNGAMETQANTSLHEIKEAVHELKTHISRPEVQDIKSVESKYAFLSVDTKLDNTQYKAILQEFDSNTRYANSHTLVHLLKKKLTQLYKETYILTKKKQRLLITSLKVDRVNLPYPTYEEIKEHTPLFISRSPMFVVVIKYYLEEK